MRAILAIALLTVTEASCGTTRDCPPGQVPNDLLQSCVTPPPCDAGAVNERNECVLEQATLEAGADGRVSGVAGRGATGGSPGGRAGTAGTSSDTQAGRGGGAGVERNHAGAEADAGVEAGRVSAAGHGGVNASQSGNGGMAGNMGPTCGDGHVDPGETCDGNCPTQCPAPSGCMRATLSGSANECDAQCESSSVAMCANGDGCCPMGCTHATDDDCSKSCGDGVVDAPETCEPGSKDKPCPEGCDDGNACTKDILTGTGEQCSAACEHMPIDVAHNADGCCPAGANIGNDNDCPAKCGDGIKTGSEKCDGDCPSSCGGGSGCMREMLVGSADECTAACMPTVITSHAGGDGCCPSGANASNDSDCATRCGDGVVSGSETCDPSSETLCVSSCADDRNPCTADNLTGSAADCSAKCGHDPISGCSVSGKFTINTETVTDPSWHITWQRNLPAIYPGCKTAYDTNAPGPGDACNLADAQAYCSSLGGGWRLPDKQELESIVDKNLRPTVDTTAFPNTKSESFWTNTLTSAGDRAYFVDFFLGSTGGAILGDGFRVRCVRTDPL